ncbi:hypothetical protein C8K15_1013 [Paenisporosarcina sp. OV554]|nr:hypothetical protein C8K15_1013 [Paenisporosarcina sp. OV554]
MPSWKNHTPSWNRDKTPNEVTKSVIDYKMISEIISSTDTFVETEKFKQK